MMRLWTRDEVFYELPLAGEAQPRESEKVDMQTEVCANGGCENEAGDKTG